MSVLIHRFIFLFGLFLFQTGWCFSQSSYHKEIPDLPAKPALVNDFADMLTTDEEMQLEHKLLNFENESSNEITIVTVTDLGGLEVSEYATELGRKWDIGKKTKKNGVLILASKNDRKINISPGYGLSGALPDITCGRIIRNYIVPAFKEGNYYQGFESATTAIIGATKGEFKNDELKPDKSKGPSVFSIIVFLIIIIIYFFFRRNSNNLYVSRRGYRYGNDGWGSRGGGWLGGFGGFGGGGGGSSSGGGFGGFGGGGGGFDGGGASGSW